MRRRLLDRIAILSLVLCLTVVVLWVRSYTKCESFALGYRNGGSDAFRTYRGSFIFERNWVRRPGVAEGFTYVQTPLPGPWVPPGSHLRRWRWGPFVTAGNSGASDPSPDAFGVYHAVGATSKDFANVSRSEDPQERGRQEQLRIQSHAESVALSNFHNRRWWLFAFPAWSVFLLLMLPSFAWTLIRLRKAMAIGGYPICSNCGYDLRATPQRCPECGPECQ